MPVLADQQDPLLIVHREDADRTWMLDHIAGRLRAVGHPHGSRRTVTMLLAASTSLLATGQNSAASVSHESVFMRS